MQERRHWKKLAGAALNSFMKKCEFDAKAKCEADLGGKEVGGCRKDQPQQDAPRTRSETEHALMPDADDPGTTQ